MNERLETPPAVGKAVLMRHVATNRFEAARQLDLMPQGNKFQRLHGHGFVVSVQACVPKDCPPYAGGELPLLLADLKQQTKQLDYQWLNDVMVQPSDLNIARWFSRQIQVPGVSGVGLQSTPDQGVLVGDKAPVVWRRYRFQAAHQLPNVQPGHKCGRMHGHGFEVVLYASTNGSLDYDTLDAAWAQVAGLLSHRCLNDVAGLENPTSEILSSWLWHRIKTTVPSLEAVTVYETASCGATFTGDVYRIWKDFTIDSAVRYRHASVADPLAGLHGYTYTLRLHLCAPIDQVMGWTVDFGDVKEVFTPVFKSLDHHPLHENPELAAVSGGDTGSMAQWLFGKAGVLLPSLVRIDLFETEGCGSSVGIDLDGPILPLVRG